MPESEDRLLTEKQVAAVLRRAAQLQEGGGAHARSPRGGIAPSELVQIGGELGLDSNCVQQAISEVTAEKSPQGWFGWMSGPTLQEAQRQFDGDLTDEFWDALVAESRRTFGKIGSTTVVGGLREWSTGDNDLDSVTVSARESKGKVVVRVASNMTNGSVLSVVLGSLLSVVVTALVAKKWQGSVEEKLVAILVLITAVVAISRGLYGSSSRRRTRAIRRFLDQAESLGAQSKASVPSSQGTEEAVDAELRQRT